MRIACVQANVVFDDPETNSERAISELAHLAAQDVQVAIFPEAFLTGYCVESLEDAQRIAIKPDSKPLSDIRRACDDLELHGVVGFAERGEDGVVYNSAALFQPSREPLVYRKSHIPELGLDKHVGKGNELLVFDTAVGRIGILICFDSRFPEASRVLALKGAELIVLPTNWPQGAEISAGHICIARAAENRVFFATCNRVGIENGFTFIGQSKIISPTGSVLASAGSREETITADVDLAQARLKRNVMIPGKYETDVIGARRPELYGVITEK